MRLTTFSDYALRILLYAATAGDRLITIEETAKVFGISRAHLMKVVNALTLRDILRRYAGCQADFCSAGTPKIFGWRGHPVGSAGKKPRSCPRWFFAHELTLIKARAATGS